MATRNWLHPPAPRPAATSAPAFERASIGDRLPAFECAGYARQRLARAVVTVIGLGSIGRPMAEHLARLGVGTLQLIDRGVLKPQSLLTHASTLPQDIRQSKASSAASLCKQIRPDANVLVFDGAIEDLPPAALLDSDIVLLASDNLAAEVCVGQYCAWLGKVLVQLSVHGESLIAHARVWRNNAKESPCPRCGFGEAEEDHLRSGQHFSCDGGAAPATHPTQPTMSTSALCSLAASMGATLALRHILSLGEELSDAMYEWCGFTAQSWSGPLRRRDDCPTDHRPWEIVRAPHPLAELSLRQIAATCGMEWSAALQFEVDEFVFPDAAPAAPSTTSPSPSRFVEAGVIPRIFSRPRVRASMLQHLVDARLAQITPAAPRWVKVMGDSRICLVADHAAREQS
jgi:molybdopterin/thiamine biosynthesis adenylyltransferase